MILIHTINTKHKRTHPHTHTFDTHTHTIHSNTPKHSCVYVCNIMQNARKRKPKQNNYYAKRKASSAIGRRQQMTTCLHVCCWHRTYIETPDALNSIFTDAQHGGQLFNWMHLTKLHSRRCDRMVMDAFHPMATKAAGKRRDKKTN